MDLNGLQKKLAAWQWEKFPPESSTIPLMALGVAEETGALAHAVLKGELGYEAEDVLESVAEEVLARDWKANPAGEGFSQHNGGQ